MRSLNKKQACILQYHRNWCKKAIYSLRNKLPIEPYFLFISGPGGVGKSHVISMLYRDTIHLVKKSIYFQPYDIVILLTAPTGVAAFNISGMTIHSALGFNAYSEELSSSKQNSMSLLLKGLQVLIIDEISMVSSQTLLKINNNLQRIKGNRKPFGNVSVICVGDLFQLKPCDGSYVFGSLESPLNDLLLPEPMFSQFKLVQLDEIMRQRDDLSFAELLCRVRIGKITSADILTLESRELKKDVDGYPIEALHVFATNALVDGHNYEMIKRTAERYEVPILTCLGYDKCRDEDTHLLETDVSKLPLSKTGNLRHTLCICKKAKVMLTINLDVQDGLVNGATGMVSHMVVTDRAIECILVEFGQNVGQNAIQKSHYKNEYPHAVPVFKVQGAFSFTPKINKKRWSKNLQVTRRQFPLTPCFACTIHKVQGLTLDEIVVDMKGSYGPGQAYVGFSRVKKLSGLYVQNFSVKKIRVNTDVLTYMDTMENLEVENIFSSFSQNDNGWLIVGHLNVNGFRVHNEDFLTLENIKNFDALCVTDPFEKGQGHYIITMDIRNLSYT